MELATRNAVEDLLPEEKMTAGTLINIRYFAVAPDRK
jgi:Mg/Co/Ni transporter MgtE